MSTIILVTAGITIFFICGLILFTYYAFVTAAELKRMKKELARSQQEAEEKIRQAEKAIKEIEEKSPVILYAKKEIQEAMAEAEGLKEELTQSQLEGEKNKRRVEEAKVEAERLKSSLNDEMEKAKAGENEIKRLKEQLGEMGSEGKEFEERVAGLKKIESDILWLEKVLNEQEKSSHQMKQRIEKNRIRMQLLNEKTRENVELIAHFAEGKEFDEFRKSIYLDEIIQKYEKEIKDLSIRNMELKKKLGMEGDESETDALIR